MGRKHLPGSHAREANRYARAIHANVLPLKTDVITGSLKGFKTYRNHWRRERPEHLRGYAIPVKRGLRKHEGRDEERREVPQVVSCAIDSQPKVNDPES